MSDFDSDLTDIDDEEDVPLSQSQSHKKPDTEYRIRGALNAPRATSYTTQALHEMLEQGDIDLEADYQRGIVWPPVKQTGLIDSIFRNFYVPPVIFAVTYSTDGTEKRVCIDGKQRLTSIWKFMQGTIPFKDSITGDKFFYKDNLERAEKGKFKMLPERYKKVFKTKQIVCVEYTQLNPDNEREIFQRVQLGMALTPAERLQAIYGPTSVFIRTLIADYVHNELEATLQWDTGRANDFRCIATAVYCMEKAATTLPGVPSLLKWLEEKRELDPGFQENAHSTLKIFVAMARSREFGTCFRMEDTKEKTSRGQKKKPLKVSPIEFISSVVLIHHHKRKLTLRQMTEAIQRMRLNVRSVETDIRANSRVFKQMLAFIKDLKATQLPSDRGQPAAVAGIELYSRGDMQKEDERGASSSKKRTRGDSDDEYVEPRKPAAPSSRRNTNTQPARAPSPVQASSPVVSSARTPVDSYPPHRQTATPSHPLTSAHSQSLSMASSHGARPSFSQAPPQPSIPTGPRAHPDRLAAIRSARSTDQQRGPPSPAVAAAPDKSWEHVGMRLGPGPLVPPHSGSLQTSAPNPLTQEIMSRMQMPYQSALPPPPRGYPPPEPVPSYDPRQLNGPNGYAPYRERRESYPRPPGQYR